MTTLCANRRRESRRRAKSCTKVVCHIGGLDLGENTAKCVLDVTETGIRLIIREEMAKNQEVTMTLQGPGHPRPLRTSGRVVWCLETADNNYCVGVLLHKRLPYIEVTRLT